jgi:hypothetical protein
MVGRLVGCETGAERRQLEQDAARLAEVDRLEPEAIDYLGRVRAGLQHPLAPLLMLVVLGRPRHVVDAAGTLQRALGRRLVVDVEAAAS